MTADDRRKHLAAAFSVALQEMELVQDGDLTYNAYHLSAGGRVLDGAEARWLRVRWQFARRWDREGWAASASIPGVAKPTWYRTHVFEYGDDCMRGDLLSLAPSVACAPGPVLVTRPVLGDEWFAELRGSVEALERWPTDRISMDGGRVAARILGRVGSAFPSRLDRLVANHMDLHWCNVTAAILRELRP